MTIETALKEAVTVKAGTTLTWLDGAETVMFWCLVCVADIDYF